MQRNLIDLSDGRQTDLTTLAAHINTEHDATRSSARTTLDHARRAGDLLNEAKGLVGHGKWLGWLKANVSFSAATASRYMKVATGWEKISNSSSVHNLTEATALLAEPRENDEDHSQPNNWRPFHELPQESRADLCKNWWDIQASRTVLYHAAGWSVAQIVDLVQAPEHEVNGVLTPRVKILFGEPGAKLFNDERGEDRYRQVVDAHLHNTLWTVYLSASHHAASEGFPELATPLDAIASSHKRQARALPFWLFVDCDQPGFEEAVNTLAISDSRKALGCWTEPEESLVFRMAKLMEVIEDVENNFEAPIDWGALERAGSIKRISMERNLNPATLQMCEDNADRQAAGGAD